MNRIITIAAFLLIAAIATAQTTVRGTVVDKTTGQGEPFATVRVFKQGNTEKAAAMFLTDVDGHFSQQVKGQGMHDIVVSSLGKNDLRRSIELTGGTVSLDTLCLEESSASLGAVVVTAQKPLVKMEVDKMTYNVSEDDDAKASTVLDMLRKVPMVTVDGQDNISVNGSSSFKVYVDGKPNVMFSSNPSMIFKNMPATAVKNIEVVTNPGARYDAEGAAGVLNIVLNKQDGAAQPVNGYNGTMQAQAGTTGWGAGLFLSGQQKKLSYSTSVVQNYMSPNTTKVYSEMVQPTLSQTSDSRTKTRIPFTMASLSLGYDIDSMNTVGLTAQFTNMQMKNTGDSHTTLLQHAAPTASTLGAWTYGDEIMLKNRNTSLNASADYQHFFNTDRSSWMAITYQLTYSPTRNRQRNEFYGWAYVMPINTVPRYSDNHETTTEHVIQADYTTPVAEGQTLNVGAKAQLRMADSDADYFLMDVLQPELGMDYEHRNRIAAAYAEYEGKWGSYSAKAGLRYEHTWQNVEYKLGNGQDFTTDYGNLVPSASVSYSLAPTVNFGLTYNMRISRPGITYLNPYVDRSDPLALTYGNTNLDVEKTHNVALVFNAFTPKLMVNLNLSHNFTDNAIEQYSFSRNDTLHTTYGNIVSRHRTALNGFLNWLAHKNTRIILNGGVNYTDLRSDELDARNSGWAANAMVGLQQTLPWQLKLGAFLITQSKTYTLQGWSGGANLLVGTLTKSFFKDKLTIGLQGITGLNDHGCLKIETYSQGTNFSNHMNIRVPLYGGSLTLTYAFGNTAKQFSVQRQTRIENDFIEQKSQGEMIQGAGSMGN